jgi:2-polyprenyl-3-methyl-5-hydroxy-6-metoxy-1,4-benzoquinol methylase
MANVNDTYFEGHYKNIWRSLIPKELTPKEIDFMISFFTLDQHSKVLDLMCGYGRHSIGLAEKGIGVTAVDNLHEYITEIDQKSTDSDLTIKTIQTDVLKFRMANEFDLVICMGNSLNFFNAEDTKKILQNAHASLKENGQLLINTWSLSEIVIPGFVPNTWSEVNGMKYLQHSKYLFHPTRIEWDSYIISEDGQIEQKKAIDYIFSVSEIESMLVDAGFELVEIFSIPGRKVFALAEPRAYIIAKKLK